MKIKEMNIDILLQIFRLLSYEKIINFYEIFGLSLLDLEINIFVDYDTKSLIRNGYLESLKIKNKSNILYDYDDTCYACMYKQYDILKYFGTLENENCDMKTNIGMEEACSEGNLELVKILVENNLDGSHDKNSNIYDMFENKLINENGYVNILNHAVRCNYIDIVKYLHTNEKIGEDYIIDCACDNNNYEMIKYLCDIGYPITLKSLKLSYEHNQTLYKYLVKQNNFKNDPKILNFFVKINDKNMVKTMVKKGVSSNKAFELSYNNENYNLMKYFHTNEMYEMSTYYIDVSCKFGQYKMVKFLIKLGFVFSNDAIKWATINKNKKLLNYLLNLK